jgi:hypothetical protein
MASREKRERGRHSEGRSGAGRKAKFRKALAHANRRYGRALKRLAK